MFPHRAADVIRKLIRSGGSRSVLVPADRRKARAVGEVKRWKRAGRRVVGETDAGQTKLVIRRGALDRKGRVDETVRESEAELVHHFRGDCVVPGDQKTAIVLDIDVVRQ